MQEKTHRARHDWRIKARHVLAGTALTAGLLAGTAGTANAAVLSTFSPGTGQLTVFGDSVDNSIELSRNAAGTILVNGGAVQVVGGTPTVANTARIQAFGQGGNDSLTLNEANGALPVANLFGGSGNDTLTGGSGGDMLFGQSGNDALLGKGGTDFLFGGSENDTLTGGDASDQVFGESGNDRAIWNPGDDTDLNEGGADVDTTEVNGGNGTEQFTATANGTRVRFDRLNPAPFAIDIGTSENLVVNANGGSDTFSATGNLAALISITVDGGTGNDQLLGSNGRDVLIAGDGEDFVDGQQGNDVAFLGAGNDDFQWDPGDGSDTVEGQSGTDELVFNGSNGNEIMRAAANGGRVLFTRNLGNIVMDLDDVEQIRAKAFGGTDQVIAEDLTGTDVVDVAADLRSSLGGDDAAADNVVVNGTSGDDVAIVTGSGTSASVLGLAARVAITGGIAGSDRVTVNTLAGDDVVDASSLAASALLLTADGGADDDVLIGGAGPDTLLGGPGDDVLLGGAGVDILDGGPGDNVVIASAAVNTVRSAKVAGKAWLDRNASTVKGKTVLKVDGEKRTLPRAKLAKLKRVAR